MGSASISDQLKSVVVTNVTPFAEDGSVDLDSVGRQASYMVDRGIQVVVPCGNTGEYTSLVMHEAKDVTAAVADAVGDRAFVLAGVGWSSGYAIEQAQHAESVGAHAVMVHHPVHTYIDRKAVRKYYERIIESVGIGVVLYKRGPELSDALIADLVNHPRVVGVKYAVNDLNAFANLVAGSTADVAWVCGTAERWAPFFALAGAEGFTSGLANFAPERSLELLSALRSGDWELAMKVRAQLLPLEELRQDKHAGNNVPVVKEGMRMLELDTGRVRDPVDELSDDERAQVRKELVALGYLDR